MPDLNQRLDEDRAMRDAAKSLVTGGLHNLRGDMEEQGVASRMAQRMREGAEGVGDDLGNFARQNPGRIASVLGLGAALLLGWIFRDRLSEAYLKLISTDDTDETATTIPVEQDASRDHSNTD